VKVDLCRLESYISRVVRDPHLGIIDSNHRCSSIKVPRSSLARSPRVAVLAASLSEGSSSSSSLPASLSLGVQEASVVEKAPPASTSTSVPSLRKDEDLGGYPCGQSHLCRCHLCGCGFDRS
jgi:hypothetical protein